MPTHIEITDRPSNENDQAQIAKYQNSYRLESNNVFKCEAVDQLVAKIMNENLENFSYDSKGAMKLSSETASKIQRKVRTLRFDRYKIVVTVSIIEKTGQSMRSVMGFMWDPQRDNYSTYEHEGHNYYAYCCVFGLYYE